MNVMAPNSTDTLTVSQSGTPSPDNDIVMRVIVESRGNHKLAQDVLKHEYGWIVSIHDIVDVIKDRLPELKAQMEVVTTLELFSLMPQLHKTLQENLSNLEGGEAVTAYMKLMELIQRSTASNEMTLNINDQRFKQAPRELQRVYAALEAAGKLEQVVEGEFVELEQKAS